MNSIKISDYCASLSEICCGRPWYSQSASVLHVGPVPSLSRCLDSLWSWLSAQASSSLPAPVQPAIRCPSSSGWLSCLRCSWPRCTWSDFLFVPPSPTLDSTSKRWLLSNHRPRFVPVRTSQRHNRCSLAAVEEGADWEEGDDSSTGVYCICWGCASIICAFHWFSGEGSKRTCSDAVSKSKSVMKSEMPLSVGWPGCRGTEPQERQQRYPAILSDFAFRVHGLREHGHPWTPVRSQTVDRLVTSTNLSYPLGMIASIIVRWVRCERACGPGQGAFLCNLQVRALEALPCDEFGFWDVATEA